MTRIYLNLQRQSVNFLTAVMPTMSGLYLATVLDGKKGRVVLDFDEFLEGDMMAMLKALALQFPDEPGWNPDPVEDT